MRIWRNGGEHVEKYQSIGCWCVGCCCVKGRRKKVLVGEGEGLRDWFRTLKGIDEVILSNPSLNYYIVIVFHYRYRYRWRP